MLESLSKRLEVALGLLTRPSSSPLSTHSLHCFMQRIGESEVLEGVGKYNSSLATVIERWSVVQDCYFASIVYQWNSLLRRFEFAYMLENSLRKYWWAVVFCRCSYSRDAVAVFRLSARCQSRFASATDSVTWLILPVVICLSKRFEPCMFKFGSRWNSYCEKLIRSVFIYSCRLLG